MDLNEGVLREFLKAFGQEAKISENKFDKKKQEAAILLIYNTSKKWIFRIADNVTKGILSPEAELKLDDVTEDVKLPNKEEWDFHLGDPVKIKVSRQDFKRIQNCTLGWNPRLNVVYGQVGFVQKVQCSYENSIRVYFPGTYSSCSLYAGILEKVEIPRDPNLFSQWKPDDYVTTLTSQETLQLMQRGLDQIPEDLIGKRGRVVAVTHPCVLVTFDEKKTYDLKPSSLVRCNDRTPILQEQIVHTRGFKVGEKVRIISNLKKLIENQKNYGGWSASMAEIRGEKAVVIKVKKDGSLNVQKKNGKARKLNSESVLHEGEEEIHEEDLKYLPGDVVKMIIPENVMAILAMARIPSAFLEFIRTPAQVTHIHEDFSFLVRFDHDQNVQTHSDLLRKATVAEKAKYEEVQAAVKDLKKNDTVYLDVGPPNYVLAVLGEIKPDASVKMALTEPATLLGFLDSYNAVIKYENGMRCRVKKKYLTVPAKFYVKESSDTISVETLGQIRDAIAKGVEEAHAEKSSSAEDWNVEILYLSHSNPTIVEFKIQSMEVTFDKIFAWLFEHSGWSIERLSDRELIVKGIESYKRDVKVSLVFNDEPNGYNLDAASSRQLSNEEMRLSYKERPSIENRAVGFDGASQDRRPPAYHQIQEQTLESQDRLYYLSQVLLPNEQHLPTVDSMGQLSYLRVPASDPYSRILGLLPSAGPVVRSERRLPNGPLPHSDGTGGGVPSHISRIQHFHNA